MSLLPFKQPSRAGDTDPYIAPMLLLGNTIDYIPFAERPGSPQETFQNAVFRVRRVFDVPWHLRWHFMYAMIGDVGTTGADKIARRLPAGYSVRDFTSIYDRPKDATFEAGKLENPWLFASSIDSVEGVGFDGKDSLYVGLTKEQLFGDITNANKPSSNAQPVANQEPPEYNITSEFSSEKRKPSRPIKSEDSQNFYQNKNSTLQRLRFIREEISKHDIAVVYKDVIRELKNEEKKIIKESKKEAEEKKQEYKTYLSEIKKENKKPIKSNFNALVKGLPTRIQATNNPDVKGAYPETSLVDLVLVNGNVDPLALCKYKLARITVSFENLAYRIVSDLKGSTNLGQEELAHDVNTTFFRMPTAEFLSLPFGAYRYVDAEPSKRYVVQGSNMRLIAQEEILLTWHRVPFIPDAVKSAIGSVNDDWFPISHLTIPDAQQSVDLNQRIWAAPGTLLLTNVEIKPYKHFFSRRVYDINYKFKYFHASEMLSDGTLQHAYSDKVTTTASHPCKPATRDRKTCQKQAKGHNYFLKYMFVNVTDKTTNDVKTTKTVDGVTTTTTTSTGNPFSGTTYQTCSVSGALTPNEKCDPAKNTALFDYELITHDGCPTGRPVYLSSDFYKLFYAPANTGNGCSLGPLTNFHPALTPTTPVSGQSPSLVVSHNHAEFSTTINDAQKPNFVTPTVTKAKTPNNRLRK